ncbi:hypothetical protein [Celeribacter indicus]|uniref:Response regulatory domain-containing protein n=1 Tax=Celeribacter indicus TaxID=1208324 RepID=A0A0B5E0Q4_9RHOB|nr:hypothetical protein [Celeribacter indicus]AJE48849.1 hypothetical protein P73_4134 [Celeribacter indicus]SDW39071.1 hypothetical protein SAMN05443573_10354 [Celeribacter indicus]
MLQHPVDISASSPVGAMSGATEAQVLVLSDWPHLPYEMSRPGAGIYVNLLRGESCDQAMDIVRSTRRRLDVLVIDEDFFGSPEAAAEACMQIRRTLPQIRIIGIDSEFRDGISVLAELGLCHDNVPAKTPASALLGSIHALIRSEEGC